jgi:hypothetical protein
MADPRLSALVQRDRRFVTQRQTCTTDSHSIGVAVVSHARYGKRRFDIAAAQMFIETFS